MLVLGVLLAWAWWVGGAVANAAGGCHAVARHRVVFRSRANAVECALALLQRGDALGSALLLARSGDDSAISLIAGFRAHRHRSQGSRAASRRRGHRRRGARCPPSCVHWPLHYCTKLKGRKGKKRNKEKCCTRFQCEREETERKAAKKGGKKDTQVFKNNNKCTMKKKSALDDSPKMREKAGRQRKY